MIYNFFEYIKHMLKVTQYNITYEYQLEKRILGNITK